MNQDPPKGPTKSEAWVTCILSGRQPEPVAGTAPCKQKRPARRMQISSTPVSVPQALAGSPAGLLAEGQLPITGSHAQAQQKYYTLD